MYRTVDIPVWDRRRTRAYCDVSTSLHSITHGRFNDIAAVILGQVTDTLENKRNHQELHLDKNCFLLVFITS